MKKKTASIFTVFLGLVLVLPFFADLSRAAEEKKADVNVVSEGKTVKANYTLTVDGKVEDSSKERGPLEFKVGSNQVIPGFEKALMGMKAGEKKSFKVAPEEAYGPVDPGALQSVPRSQLPPEITPKVGMMLTAAGKDGQSMPVRIVEVKDDVVVMDFNHPLAGKTLDFDVEVVEVK
jgi:FKBP-type peptidyl-prolyl cis-trans isomerase 2